MGQGWLLDRIGGKFTILAINCAVAPVRCGPVTVHVETIEAALGSPLAERYLGGAPCAVYLVRPDQHVAARWQKVSEADLVEALGQAWGA